MPFQPEVREAGETRTRGRSVTRPKISRFYGIAIGMFYQEHRPPHFHVRYGEHQGVVRINDLVITEGWLPARVLGMVVEWGEQHRGELLPNWEAIENRRPLRKIEPLD